MRKYIFRLLCSFAVLATVALPAGLTGKPSVLEIKPVSAKSSNGATAAAEAITRSAASLRGSPLATGSLVAGFGSGFANSTETAPDSGNLPTILAGATVTVVDFVGIARSCRMAYASPVQINHDIPVGTALGPATIIYTNTVTGDTSISSVDIVPVEPGLFSVEGTGSGFANSMILRKRNGIDIYEPISRFENNQHVAVPIDFGPETDQLFLVLFGTGFRFRSSLTSTIVTVGGTPLDVIYAGPAGSGSPGIDQANVPLPRTLAGRGLVNIVMTADGLVSNTVQLVFQ